jgi:hypothetical protein
MFYGNYPPDNPTNFLRGILIIATYAKFLNKEDVYEQAKYTYNKVADDYNAKYCPKKSFWKKYKENFIEGMGGYTSSYTPIECFDEGMKSDLCTQLFNVCKSFPRNKIEELYLGEMDSFNKKYK